MLFMNTNQKKEEVDRSDQMEVSYQVDRRSKFRFDLRLFRCKCCKFQYCLRQNGLNSRHVFHGFPFQSCSLYDWKVFEQKNSSSNITIIQKIKRRELWCCWSFTSVCSNSHLVCSLLTEKNENRTFVRCVSCNVPPFVSRRREIVFFTSLQPVNTLQKLKFWKCWQWFILIFSYIIRLKILC